MSSLSRRSVGVCVAHEAAVDGVGQPSFETSQGSSVALAGGAFALVVRPGASLLIWVMAMMCRQ